MHNPSFSYKSMLKSKIMKKIIFQVVPVALLVWIAACSALKSEPEAPPSYYKIKKLLILPFKNITDMYGEAEIGRCPLCGVTFLTGKVPDSALILMTKHLVSWLKQYTDFELVTLTSGEVLLPDFIFGAKKKIHAAKLIVETGRKYGADAVAAGYIYRFDQRVGNRYSVDSPASIAFGIHIVDVETGRVLWAAHFDEKQHALSDNLLDIGTFIKRKAGWVTAEEMAVSGLEEKLKTLPKP